MKVTEAKTILVTFLMQLGDLILITPFLTALRRAAPDAKITLLMDERWRDVMTGNEDVDEILTIDRKGRDNRLMALWHHSRKLKTRGFDMTVNLNPSERCSFLAAFSGAKYITGPTPAVFRPWFDRVLKLDRKRHAADMYLDILTQMGVVSLSHDGLKIRVLPEHEKEANAFFSGKVSDSDKIIGFNIGSASATKCWLPERFAEVADELAGKDYKVVFFGSKAELPMVKAAVSLMKEKAIVATGQFSVGALAAALRRLTLLITNDSGPMHIAVSQKTPLVALYGPSKPELYGPYAFSESTVVQAEPLCMGCNVRMKHQCNDMRCMNDLTTQQVLDATYMTLRGSST